MTGVDVIKNRTVSATPKVAPGRCIDMRFLGVRICIPFLTPGKLLIEEPFAGRPRPGVSGAYRAVRRLREDGHCMV